MPRVVAGMLEVAQYLATESKAGRIKTVRDTLLQLGAVKSGAAWLPSLLRSLR